MVYQAIKNDVGLNAAAVFNTPTDLIGLYNDSISARKKVFEEKLVNKFNEIGYKDYKAIINSDMDWEFVINRSIEWIKEKTEIHLEI